ncbi:alpha/beta hydrolase [Mucilaginibacter boryungensis]|uniref:Alpha/beta hydrolase n=1 Tax=Mucilaginibacter boryungensis TaxID=768480 RepID=A0ABR9XML0_9SPHI|nr:alpha/beta hydrolase [Mucilaginibacter boryungensis]MBE9668618.1 alpha/beta hydrolase [Mucilaginibacter boryungensis]
MIKRQILIFSALLVMQNVIAQSQPGKRYKDIVFNDILLEKDLSYNSQASKDQKKSYLFDLYQPKGDDASSRPLIIWMHGGGFKFGSKTAKGVKLWSQTFARRGYVCASINYRLSKANPLFHFDDLLKGSFYATQDAKLAVAYFRTNAAKYHIDPDKIILGGNSAGGFIALNAAYSKNEDFGRLANIADDEIKSSGVPHRPIYAVINYWGSIYDLGWLSNAKTPIISVHGSEDGLVPITHKNSSLYGSLDIHNKADALHIPNTLKVYKGYSHELQKHFNPFFEGSKAQSRWLEAAQFTADYLYGIMK